MTLDELQRELRAIIAQLVDLDLSAPDTARASLMQTLPPGGPRIAGVRRLAEAGRDAGWLLPREAGGIRFGRAARDLGGFSVDAVLLAGSGPRHRHPNGEVDLCFATAGTPRFCGHEPGWAVFEPGSSHVPAVEGGEMLILYFLPGGAIEWLPHD